MGLSGNGYPRVKSLHRYNDETPGIENVVVTALVAVTRRQHRRDAPTERGGYNIYETGFRVGKSFYQSVSVTSNACAPIDEASPSVWPARYITTPFPFVSLACIFPSIRVSPRLTP
jgi:hypothetical protein